MFKSTLIKSIFFLLILPFAAYGNNDKIIGPCYLLNEIQVIQKSTNFEKKNLLDIINNGTYAFIESDSLDLLDSPENRVAKFRELGEALDKEGLPHRQIAGSYNGDITTFSYLVLNPKENNIKEFRRTIFKLGKQFKQESIILSSNSKVQLIFTTGLNVGRAYSGQGFEKTANKNFSVIKCDCPNNQSTCTIDQQCLVMGQYNLNYKHLSEILEEFKDLL